MSIDPANPPTPIPSSLPFHPETGSQTSSLMSESEVGFASAMTRQNAGRLLYKRERPGEGAGGPLNVPAATVCASVIAMLGIVAAARCSQASAFWAQAAALENSSMNARANREDISFIVLS